MSGANGQCLRLPLRLLVPLGLLLFAVVVVAHGLLVDLRTWARRVEREAVEWARHRMSQLQDSLEAVARTAEVELLRQRVAMLSAQSDVRRALLVDERDRVIAATGPAALGQPLEEAWPALAAPPQRALRARPRESSRGSIAVVDGGRTLEVRFPVALGAPGASRPPPSGLLLVALDISPIQDRVRRELLLRVMWTGLTAVAIALLLGLLFHFGVAARIARLLRATSALAGGDLSARAGVRGYDEIGQLGAAFDDMASRLAEGEEKLRRSEAGFRALIETSPDAICVVRGQRVVFANAAAAHLLGRSVAELVGAPIAGFVHPEDRARVGDPALREIRFLGPQGRQSVAETLWAPVEFAGAPAQAMIARDLTDTRRLQSRMMQVDRLASIGVLAAGVAHEINNPLTYVLGNLELVGTLLERGQGESSIVRSALADARDGAQRVRDIVRDLRVFARSDDDGSSAVDVERLLETSLKMVAAEIKERALVERRYGDVPPVLGSESRLGQVFVNLLVNAAQAIPPGRPGSNRIRVRTAVDTAGRIVIEIADTGIGIAPDQLHRIFEPFFTTKGVGVGTGLGLAICHGIVDGMGGQISVHSSPGTGASFRVCLPPADTAGPGARSGQRSGAEPADRAHIVVVDDETLVARLLRRILEGTHHVEVFTSPRLALGYLRSTEDCDLILCDIAMPEFTGPALYRALESVRPELAERMVFMTGATMQPETHAFLASRGRPWLEKPFTGEEVLAMVTRMREARRGAPRRGAVHGEPQPAAPSQ